MAYKYFRPQPKPSCLPPTLVLPRAFSVEAWSIDSPENENEREDANKLKTEADHRQDRVTLGVLELEREKNKGCEYIPEQGMLCNTGIPKSTEMEKKHKSKRNKTEKEGYKEPTYAPFSTAQKSTLRLKKTKPTGSNEEARGEEFGIKICSLFSSSPSPSPSAFKKHQHCFFSSCSAEQREFDFYNYPEQHSLSTIKDLHNIA